MVFPTCSSVSSSGAGLDCYINIAFNQQLPLCATTEPSVSKGVLTCRPPDNLCIADSNFKYDFSDGLVRFPLSALFPEGPTPSLLVQDTSFSPSIPLSLTLGDVNLDGFPDILLIVSSSQGRTPKMIYSVPCSHGIAGCDQSGNGKRGWQVATKGVKSLEAVKDARGISFVDMDEDVSFLTLELPVHTDISLRAPLTLWFNELAQVTSCLCKTISTTTRSSSKLLVRPLDCLGIFFLITYNYI